MKYIISNLLLILSIGLSAQTAVDAYNIYNNPAPATSNNMAQGWINASAPYDNAGNYNIFYGKLNAAANGTTREIVDFTINAGPAMGNYIPIPFSPNQPFDTVIVKRKDNLYTTGRRVNSLYELGSFDAGTGTLYLQPQYNETMEDIINRKYLNVGSDNTFVNDNSSTTNNIERLDLIFSTGVTASTADLSKVGILINDRGGNDYFKIAAITSIDVNKNVTSLGNLVSILPATWGAVGPVINTVVMSKEEADFNLRPKEDIGAQPISGVFISLFDLGITTGGTSIKGVSLFPNDVNAAMDLLGLSDVPTNTAGGAIGGLDLMAGCGFFRETGTLVILPIQFIDIQARLSNDHQVLLNWTVNDDNTSTGNFIIERSNNAAIWQNIGQIEASNRSGGHYNHTDENPATGKNFYRVKVTDAQGKTTHSKVVSITVGNKKKTARIDYAMGSNYAWIHTGSLSGVFTVRFIDFGGKLLRTENIKYPANFSTQYNISAVPATSFIMQLIHDGNIVNNQKIIQ